ncbi:hypothetical protein FKW31_03780 [Acetobacter sp. DmW_136]|uniref:hypothetical protein n=1 Tax=Acetobacter sp. DmW_136 TaxID=2591091 RepID=UPI00123A0B0C|nr:hypothetical protein [Acetobacter sp. DmW_136]KAA8387768.1 hypothetical protein FKW31_03780 [Acetobacter sp. DmW_136]
MAKLSSFTRNATAIAEGTPVTVGVTDQFIIVTKGMTADYADRLWALRRAAVIRYNTGLSVTDVPVTESTLPPSMDDVCQAQALSEKCLIDVQGLENDDGSPIDIATFNEMITHRENRALLGLALQAAASVGRATKEQLKAAEGN